MRALRYWSFTRVFLTSAAWVFLSVAVLALFLVRGFVDVSGGGGIGAVSVEVNSVMLAIPFLPPIALAVAWLIARRKRNMNR